MISTQTTQLKEVLKGHTSPETAYVVDDYPYGFRLRCKIRYWLEFKKGNGFRLVSQTTNPKVSREVWNKPKASTYTTLGVMGLNEENHVTWVGLGSYTNLDEINVFGAIYRDRLDEIQEKVFTGLKAAAERYEAQKAARAADVVGCQ